MDTQAGQNGYAIGQVIGKATVAIIIVSLVILIFNKAIKSKEQGAKAKTYIWFALAALLAYAGIKSILFS